MEAPNLNGLTDRQIITLFRRAALDRFPKTRFKVRTVSFMDLARASRLVLSIVKANSLEDVAGLNALARKYSIIGEGRAFFKDEFADK